MFKSELSWIFRGCLLNIWHELPWMRHELMTIHGNYFDCFSDCLIVWLLDCFSDCLIVWLLDCLSDLTAPATQELPLYRVRAEGACSLCRAKTTSRSNTIKHSSNHSSVVIYSLVIRSFSTLFPFHKGKNEGNTLEIDRIKNDAWVIAWLSDCLIALVIAGLCKYVVRW